MQPIAQHYEQEDIENRHQNDENLKENEYVSTIKLQFLEQIVDTFIIEGPTGNNMHCIAME